MSNQIVKIEITASDEVILNKKKAWSEVGEVVHNLNIELTNRANAAVNQLIVPTSIKDIKEAEEVFANVKKELRQIETDRKSLTSNFDAATEQLMKPEKLVIAKLKEFGDAMIKVKQEIKRIAEEESKKNEEHAKMLLEYTNQINKKYAEMKEYVATTCQKAYTHSLSEKSEVTELNLDSFLAQVKAKRFTKDAFTPSFDLENLSHAMAWKEAWKAANIPNPESMIVYAEQELKKKFEFFNVALKNKAEAVQAAKLAEEKAAADRAAELSAKETAAKLSTLAAATVVVESGVKELKIKFVIDMPDDIANNLLIANAFIACYQEIKGGVRVTSLRKISIEQMGEALAWAKNKDERFSFSGIKFKTIDKL
jgi:hypothetical protein